MDLMEGIKTRRSCRAFRPDPIPRRTMETVLEAARMAPSYTNTQPWEVWIVDGRKKEELGKILHLMASSDVAPGPDLALPKAWPPELERRSREHGARRFRSLGIERESDQQRKELRLLNFEFYRAPCVLLLFMDRTLTSWSVFDMGLFAQTLILAAHSVGLGTCLQASLASYPDAIRNFLKIPETKAFVLGISVGYPDLEAKLNAYQSTRVNQSDFVHWCI